MLLRAGTKALVFEVSFLGLCAIEYMNIRHTVIPYPSNPANTADSSGVTLMKNVLAIRGSIITRAKHIIPIIRCGVIVRSYNLCVGSSDQL